MRLERQNVPFVMIANEVLYRSDLSLRAKGLFAYMFSKPETWDFSAERIANECTEERKLVLKILRELEGAGLLVRTKLSSGRVRVRLQYAEWKDEATIGLFGAKVHSKDSGAKVPSRHGAQDVPISKTDSESKKDIYISGTPAQKAVDFFEKGRMYKMAGQEMVEKGTFSYSTVKAEFDNFISYWTEPTPGGKKVRWQLEKAFDISRRLHTWFNNVKKREPAKIERKYSAPPVPMTLTPEERAKRTEIIGRMRVGV